MKIIYSLILSLVLTHSNAQQLTVGDFHEGGIIFYLDSNDGGLIVDISDLPNPSPIGNTSLDSILSRWGNYATHVPGTSAQGVGNGELNTQNFISFYPTGNYAAHQCYFSNKAGYSDWFLPSKEELEEVFLHKILIDSMAIIYGGHAFDDFATLYPYWSSTESPSTTDFRYAYAVYPDGLSLLRSKILEYKVRAIRTFSGNTNINNTIQNSNNKKLFKIINMMGQETNIKMNTPLIYIFDDGSTEKKVIIK